MFTLENTYDDIVKSEVIESVRMLIGTMMFSNESLLSLIPETVHDKTWKEIAETIQTPWGMGFPSQEVVDAANLSLEIFDEARWEVRALWTEGQKPVFNNTKEDVCMFTPVMDDNEERPAVILCPGGAYTTLAMVNEGFGMAKEFLARGYRPYILRYRRMPNLFPCQQEDLTLALFHVFANAKKDGVNGEDIMIAGFSAGGHLCASTVTMLEEMKEKVLQELNDPSRIEIYQNIDPMPQKMILGYALTGTDLPTMDQLCGSKEGMEAYAAYQHVSAKTPKTYAWACEDDPLVPCVNTKQWGEAMEAAGRESCCRLFPTGGHGIAAGYGTSAEGWLDDMFEFMRTK